MAHFDIDDGKALDLAVDLLRRYYKHVEDNFTDYDGIPASLQAAYEVYELADTLEKREESHVSICLERVIEDFGETGLLESLDPEVVEEWVAENTPDIDRLLNHIDKGIIEEYYKRVIKKS